MRYSPAILLPTLVALLAGCASTDVPRASLGSIENRTRILLHANGDSFNSFNVTPAHLKLYVIREKPKDGGEPYLFVCSRQERITESRLVRDSCRGASRSVGVPWIAQRAVAFEEIAARALTRHLKEGTVDLSKKLVILDATPELDELDIQGIVGS